MLVSQGIEWIGYDDLVKVKKKEFVKSKRKYERRWLKTVHS